MIAAWPKVVLTTVLSPEIENLGNPRLCGGRSYWSAQKRFVLPTLYNNHSFESLYYYNAFLLGPIGHWLFSAIPRRPLLGPPS